ncbi:MAG: site-specific integrase [Chitinophagaceae bacterium]|nr:site-specific integrase [Chitinophagaceae bacterium]
MKLPAEDWDQKLQKIKSSHPQHGVINNILRLKIAELNTKFAETELSKGKVDVAEALGREVKKITFREFATNCLEVWQRKFSVATMKAYRSMFLKAIEFDPKVHLEDITPEWLARYEAYSRESCNDAGALKRVAFISVVVKEGIRQGKIDRDPFVIYKKPPKKNPAREWLTSEELARVEKLVEKNKSDIIKRTGTWFLLACYTGLRYSDIETFNHKKAIRDGRLILYTQKTGEVVSIKITGKMKKYLELSAKVGAIYTNQKANQYLKAVAQLAGIDKKITFHMARHTFAVQCANRGISQEVTSKLLGHSDLKTTDIYYKITNLRIDQEMKKWG